MLSYKEFNQIYKEELFKVMEFINDEILTELKLHNEGWNQNKEWFKNYLSQSSL